MKYLLYILFLLSLTFGAEYEDVIYLKDGSVIYGIIIEQKPGEYYKIKSGKNVFVFNVDEVDVLKKEIIDELENIHDKTWSIGIGLSTPKLPGLISLVKDFKISDNTAIYICIGLPMRYGLGVSYQQNYNDTGILTSLSYGGRLTYDYYDDPVYLAYANFSFGYQRRIKNKNSFFTFGIVYTTYEWDYYYEEDLKGEILPIISWDYRF